jgi:hypothetical protein
MEVFCYDPGVEPLAQFNARLRDYCGRANVSGIVATPLRRGVLLSLTLLEEIPSSCVLSAELLSVSAVPSVEAYMTERLTALTQAQEAPVEATALEPVQGDDSFILIKTIRGVVEGAND